MSDWYKMNPLDWNTGTDGLSLELEAAYLRICHAMYITDGPIRENSFVLAGLFRCNDRKAKRLLSDLISAGKVSVSDGLIVNRRALEVISDRSRVSVERKSAGSRGGIERANKQSKQLNNKDTSQAIASTQNMADKIREDNNIQESSVPSDSSAETAKTAPRSPTVIELPALKNEMVAVSEADVSEWSEAFPALNVGQQLAAMRSWLNANPKNRKTKAGMKRFAVSWLGRAQDKAGKVDLGHQPQKQKSSLRTHQEECAMELDRVINRGSSNDEYNTGNIIDIAASDYRYR